jgi:hypothetical protein
MCGWSEDTDLVPGGEAVGAGGAIDDTAATGGGIRPAQDALTAAFPTRPTRPEEHEDTLLRFAFGDR